MNKEKKIRMLYILSAGLLILLLVSLYNVLLINNKFKDLSKSKIELKQQASLKFDSLNYILDFYRQKSQIDDEYIENISDETLAKYSVLDSCGLFGDLYSRRYSHDSTLNERFRQYSSNISKLNLEKSNITLEKKYFVSTSTDLVKENNSLKTSINRLTESLSYSNATIKQLKEEKKSILNLIEFTDEGNSVSYLGEKKDGMADGFGVGIWSTGGIYKGDWKKNLRHGTGTYKWKDGESYHGEFVEGKRTGKGTYKWKDGETYIGEWNNNMRNGTGSIFYPNGKLKYEGIWKNDKFEKAK